MYDNLCHIRGGLDPPMAFLFIYSIGVGGHYSAIYLRNNEYLSPHL